MVVDHDDDAADDDDADDDDDDDHGVGGGDLVEDDDVIGTITTHNQHDSQVWLIRSTLALCQRQLLRQCCCSWVFKLLGAG